MAYNGILQTVIDKTSKKVKRHGHCDMASDGSFESDVEEIVEKDFLFDLDYVYEWNGVTETFDVYGLREIFRVACSDCNDYFCVNTPASPPLTCPECAGSNISVDSKLLPAREQCRAFSKTDQSINNDTYTTLEFDCENLDDNDIHDTVTDNHKFIIPRRGIYRVVVSASFEPNATGVRGLRIFLNTSNIAEIVLPAGDAVKPTIVGLETSEKMEPWDEVTVEAVQTSGAALDVQAGREKTFVCIAEI